MANPFVKGWKYLMALFGSKIDEYADPKVQIQQAIEEAQRQHQTLVQQAAAVIGNQRQLEMKLSRQLTEVENLQANARQALLLADKARAEGDPGRGAEFEQTAQTFATQLVAAEASMEDLKSLHDHALAAAARARKAVESNAMLHDAVVGRGQRQDRTAVRGRAGAGRSGSRLGRRSPAGGAEGHPGPGRLDQAGGDPGEHGPLGRRWREPSSRSRRRAPPGCGRWRGTFGRDGRDSPETAGDAGCAGTGRGEHQRAGA
jgi:PspA/IM30 family protein